MPVQAVMDQGPLAPQYWGRQHVNCLDWCRLHRRYCPNNFLLGPRGKRNDLDVKSARRTFKGANVSYRLVVGKDRYPSSSRERLMQQLQSLDVELEGKHGDACRVAVGMGHGGDELALKQVVRERHDGNMSGSLLCSARGFGPGHHEHIRARFGQLNGDGFVRYSGGANAATINRKIAAFHKSGLAKFLEKTLRSPLRTQHRNPIMAPSYLRARSKRPYCRHPAQPRNEVAPSHSQVLRYTPRSLTACGQRDSQNYYSANKSG